MSDIWVLVRTIDEFDEDLFIAAWPDDEPSIEMIRKKLPDQEDEWIEYLIEKSNNQTEDGKTYELFIEEKQ